MATTDERDTDDLRAPPGLEALRARLEERGTVGRRVSDALRFHPREVVALSLLGLLVLTGATLAYVRARPASAASIAPVSTPAGAATSPAAAPATIVVHVVGEVKRPGVYEFTEGARVVEAVRAAGGLTRRADVTGVNLARVLADGEQIIVPRRGGSGSSTGGAATGGSSGGLVNLNTATVTDLDGLPGIGPVLAQRIIDYRDQHGPFRSTQDLDKVSGIGPATLQDLLPLVTV